ncbi:MAG: sigma-70 family RNA polymerase sigma factor [Patescibacteria group bacterium]|nr:sigma-70 family RNA polymerase sigma factor [Patescibacteria group bacterium]
MAEEKDVQIDELVARVKKGDREAFSALYDELVDSVYRYIYFKVNQDDVEDLLETVFMKVWENIHQYKKRKTSFASWVFRIAHNLVVDHYRLKKDVIELSPAIPTYEREHNPIQVTQDSLNKEVLRSGIRKLKPTYQQIVILKFINELSNMEIAKIMNKSEGSLRVLQFRALKELKEVLRDMGIKY